MPVELTGWGLPTTLGCVAAVLFVLIVMGRPRLKRRWAMMTARGGLVVLLNLIVVLLVACLLNNANGFYANWGDLLSTAPPPKSTRTYGGDPTKAAAAIVPGQASPTQASAAGPLAQNLPPLPHPGKRVQTYVVTGARSHFKNDVWVRLPKNYNPAHADRYPVILAFHGFPGHPRAFSTLGNFYQDIDQLVADHQLRDPIVVMPEVNPRGSDTECVDIPGGAQADTWLSTDVPNWVRNHFRVEEGRSSWATWGYSFGGYCAMALAIRHPQEFGAAVAFQGYARPNFDDGVNPLMRYPNLALQYDLVNQVRVNRPPVATWLFSSAQDTLSYPSVRQLESVAAPPFSLTTVVYKRGGHRNLLWFGLIKQSFAWLGQNAAGFRPPVVVKPDVQLGALSRY